MVDEEFGNETGGGKLDADDHKKQAQEEERLAILDGAGGDS